MTDPERIKETYVQDGRGEKKLVRSGDKLGLLPPHLHDPDDEDGEYWGQKNNDFLSEWLGEGPYKISYIGLWPCGRVMLYVDTEKTKGAGAYASDFMSLD